MKCRWLLSTIQHPAASKQYMMKKWLYFIVFLSVTGFSRHTQTEAEEYNLKAAFIYNFTKFIDWNSFISGNEFIIGVVDSSPIYEPLAEIAQTKTVNDKKIIIRHYRKLDEISLCHVLFISRNTSLSLDDILAKTAAKGMLIVSEKAGYAKQGTAINFVVVNNKLKFEANTKAINSAGLTASSQLLKLAIIVE